MAGPGGKEVGRVSVRAVPDTSRFAKQLRKELRQIEKTARVKIPVSLNTKGIKSEIEKIRKQARGEKVKLDTELSGDGVRREAGRIRAFVQKTLGAIKTTVAVNIPASLARIRTDLAVINRSVRAYRVRIPVDLIGWAQVLAVLALLSAAVLGLQHAIGAVGGALATMGGLLATLPAITISAAAGISTLIVGMQGMGEALGNAGDPTKFAESLTKLTPSARETARALAEWREPLSQIRRATQEALFDTMAGSVNRLRRLLPPVQQMLTGTAGAVRRMGQAWIAMATSEQSVRDLGTIGVNVTRGWNGARTVLADAGAALRDLAVVGSTFLPTMGRAASDLALRFRLFMADARRTGELAQWIQNAINKMAQLGRISGNVWNALGNTRTALTNGEALLDIVERLTQRLETATGSRAGQAFLRNLGEVLRLVLDTAIDVFRQLGRTVADFLRPAMPFLREFITTLGVTLVAALKAVSGPLQGFGRWLSENRAFAVPLAIALLSIVTAFKLLVTAAKGIQSIVDGFKAIKKSVDILRTLMFGASSGGGLWGFITKSSQQLSKFANRVAIWANTIARAWITSAAKSASFTLRYYAIMVAQAVAHAARVAAAWVVASARMLAATVANTARMAAAWIARWSAMAAATALRTGMIIASWLPTLAAMVTRTVTQIGIVAATWIAKWTAMAAASLAQAARMAAAWLIAMGPVGLVIAAIVGLVALVVANWDKIKQWTIDAWNAIWKWISDRITDIVNFVKSIPARIGDAKDWLLTKGKDIILGLLRGIKQWFTDVINWFKSLPRRIASFFVNAAKWLYNAGKDLIQGLINGIKNMAKAAVAAVLNIGGDMTGAMRSALGIGSPSKIFHQYGRWTVQGLINGVKARTSRAVEAVASLAHAVTDAFSPNVSIGASLMDSITDATPGALAALDEIRMAHDDMGAEWTATAGDTEIDSIGDRVAAALRDWSVQMDGQRVARLIRNHTTADARRR